MSNESINNPHDKFFRESFGRKDIAKSFIKEYLPQDLCKSLELKSLEISKDSYVDKEMSEHFSDIVYKINILGKSSFIYLLFEHKSYDDKLVHFQLLRNMVKIWEMFIKQNSKTGKLPQIIPLLI